MGSSSSSNLAMPRSRMLISLLVSDILKALSTASPIILLIPLFLPSILIMHTFVL